MVSQPQILDFFYIKLSIIPNINPSMQLSNMGSHAITLSLPFSCILGLLASMTSTTMGILLFLMLPVLIYAMDEVIFDTSAIYFQLRDHTHGYMPSFNLDWLFCLGISFFHW